MDHRDMRDTSPGVLIGGVLVVVGVWLFLRRWLVVTPFWTLWLRVRPFGWPLALILIGIVVILLASGDRGRLHMPAAGTRLYRSRHDKWVAGVIGGLGRYFGVDPVPLRIAVVALALLFGWWQTFIAYLIAAWVMPEEPETVVAPGPPHASSPG